MAQEYLPAPSNVRLADLMKERNISQPELAKEIGCSKSTISRFISGAKGTLTHEQVLKIARLFNVSTDFLLGETNIPDRKNYDIAELGLSVEAARNLYTGRINAEVVNLLLENARFAELTYRIAQYFDDTFASGIAAQNAMLTTLSTLLRTKVKTPEAAKAAKDISLRRKPVYQGDLDDIEMYFMAAVKEIKKGIGSHYAEQEAMSKKVAEKIPLTKLWAIRIWQKMYCKRCFCTLPKIFLKFIEKTVTNSPLISLVVVEAVHTICFASSEKNRWKKSRTHQMMPRCRMMQQSAPITSNI